MARSIKFFAESPKPAYLIAYAPSASTPATYSPFVLEPQLAESGTMPHGLDVDLIAALPALWHCLHLPASAADYLNIDGAGLKSTQWLHVGQEILLLPSDILERLLRVALRSDVQLVLAFAADECAADVQRVLDAAKLNVEVVPFSKVDPTQLISHWDLIAERLSIPEVEIGSPPAFCDRIDIGAVLVPIQRLLRQLSSTTRISYPPTEEHIEVLLDYGFRLQTSLAAVAQLEREGLSKEEVGEERFAEAFARAGSSLRMPVSVSLPGLPSSHTNRVYPKVTNPKLWKDWRRFDPTRTFARLKASAQLDSAASEQAAVSFMVSHRAISRNGIGLTLDPVPQSLFAKLSRVEGHCRERSPSPKVIRRLLIQIGHELASLLTPLEQAAMARASLVDAFTNFPIGWTILPGDTSPISCRVPIAYRPILPLTRALQQELAGAPSVNLSNGIRVLLAECIPPGDRISRVSRAGLRFIEHMVNEQDKSDARFIEIASSEQLRIEIANYEPNVLLISAHGMYVPKRNIAGLHIGGEIVMGPELGPMPPLVLLSACHSAPRGTGAVNIAELLIREGALAVLATQVPVNVFDNALLMTRFLVYINESMENTEALCSAAEVWHRTVTSNAVNDILNGNKGLRHWGRNPQSGQSVLEDFMQARATGRLRLGHIYKDSEVVLRERASEDGLEGKFDAWMQHGYIPESLFYSMIGWPDRILFNRRRLLQRLGIEPGSQIS